MVHIDENWQIFHEFIQKKGRSSYSSL